MSAASIVRRLFVAAALSLPATAPAQTGMMAGPFGIPMERSGSGTTWLPDATILPARHTTWGPWDVTLHGTVFFQMDHQSGARGANQLGSVNWGMLMLTRTLAGGWLQLRSMTSLEAATLARGGYPLLLQTGETYQGAPLHDRQHPHDFFMELAALYQRPLTHSLGILFYAAPAGEPASGPVAFMHRPSAQNDPFAPITHHWQDATHITFGVITAGLFTRAWKVEASAFNGREPDENRWDFDFRRLDSYAGRVTLNPGEPWSLSASYAYLRSAEALRPAVSMHRATAAALYGRSLGTTGQMAAALVVGANREFGARTQTSVLLESNVEWGRNALFTRAEYVPKTAEELALAGPPPDTRYDVTALALGYVRDVITTGAVRGGAGVRVSLNLLPPSLAGAYGGRAPAGFAVFFRWRPAAPPAMAGMRM